MPVPLLETLTGPSAPSNPWKLESGTIGIWTWDLACAEPKLSEMKRMLSVDEHARMEKFKFDADRRRFIVARAGMRWILGRLLGEKAEELRFGYCKWGKPSLLGHNSGLKFNLSHSGDTALLASARAGELGVDLECEREDLNEMEVGNFALSAREYQWLACTPVSRRKGSFLKLWTLKEAVLKSRGLGLASDLKTFTVVPNDPEISVLGGDDSEKPDDWRCFSFSPKAKMWAAIACFRSGLKNLELAPLRRLRFADFSEIFG